MMSQLKVYVEYKLVHVSNVLFFRKLGMTVQERLCRVKLERWIKHLEEENITVIVKVCLFYLNLYIALINSIFTQFDYHNQEFFRFLHSPILYYTMDKRCVFSTIFEYNLNGKHDHSYRKRHLNHFHCLEKDLPVEIIRVRIRKDVRTEYLSR
jgi:hypothetical protein